MNALLGAYYSAAIFLPLAPFAIASVAVLVSGRSKRKWVVHSLTFLALLLFLPLYLIGASILDPAFDDMNGGEQFGLGLLMIFYLFTAGLTMVGYGIYAICDLRVRRRARVVSAS